MTWQHAPEYDADTLITDDALFRLWHMTLGNWAAVFIHHGISTVTYNFSSPDEAKTWSETQMRLHPKRWSLLRFDFEPGDGAYFMFLVGRMPSPTLLIPFYTVCQRLPSSAAKKHPHCH